MVITVEATYENGILKPKQPLSLVNGTQVVLTVTPVDEEYDPLDAVIGIGDGPADGADNHDKYIYGKIRQ
jgi:predicted DNA-binding antitoxin AbrB/MazE fold protein